eukprot:3018187-Pyramimonas_sp.AAC.1
MQRPPRTAKKLPGAAKSLQGPPEDFWVSPNPRLRRPGVLNPWAVGALDLSLGAVRFILSS